MTERRLMLLGLLAAALLTVMAFEAWRYFPFAFLFLTARIQALPRDLEKADAIYRALTMSAEQRRAMTDDMLTSEGASSGTIGAAPGSLGTP